MLRKFFKKLFPVPLRKYQSELNGVLEINMENGRKVLDTEKSNFSYGSLQRVLQKGLDAIHFNNSTETILVLGMGAGSVVQTIRTQFRSQAKLDLVEFDPLIIQLAKEEFEIEKYGNINIILSDANEYMLHCKKFYDLIIIDLFVLDTIPEIFTEKPFLELLSSHLTAGGKIIFNTMSTTLKRSKFEEMKKVFESNGMLVSVLRNIEYTNDLILAKKK